jgi:NADPH2:quinone reductase
VDVTIDALWGEPAMAAIQASGVFARHIQVGQVAAADITLPAPALRSISLDLRGFSVAHVPIDVLRDARRTLSEHVANGDIVVDLEVLPLARIAEAWERQKESASHPKLVLDPTRA